MSYAIINVGGKQYRVREGERLLVDRVALEDGATFTPPVLLVGGDGDVKIAPNDVVVTAKVLTQAKGPKIRIGKYKQRTGYKRHTGFRASLTQIRIESIGSGKGRAKPAAKTAAPAKDAPESSASGVPTGYDELTVAQVKDAASTWDAATLAAALEHERANAQRKGAIAALESAISEADS
jgi:large subunit ribosomal protein L21